jgi:hypothetical protein
MELLLAVAITITVIALAFGLFVGFAVLYVKVCEKLEDWLHPL